MDENEPIAFIDKNRHQELSSLIEFLVHIEDRIAMCIGSNDDVRSVEAFLIGIRVSYGMFGYSYDAEIESDTLSKHGWVRQSTGELNQMRKAGMSEEAIVKELIRLEVEKWQRLKDRYESTGHSALPGDGQE
jgi:hypothetical protein